MRKYKHVKEKKVIYSLPEWNEVERRASEMSLKTGTYIKYISVSEQINVININGVTPMMNALHSMAPHS